MTRNASTPAAPPEDMPQPAMPRASMRDLACAAVAGLIPANGGQSLPELAPLAFLHARWEDIGADWSDSLPQALRQPLECDLRLVELAGDLALRPIELLAVALAAAVEEDALLGRALARLQAPLGGSRPTLSLLAQALARVVPLGQSPLASLFNGPAVQSGLLTVQNDAAPLAERTLAVPVPLVLALAGWLGAWPGIRVGHDAAVELPASTLEAAGSHALALGLTPGGGLVIRSGSMAEARATAAEVARALELRPAFIETDQLAGVGPWLMLLRLLPVFVCHLGPSERRRLPELPGYPGPCLAITGPDGSVDSAQGALASWSLPIPTQVERETLWRSAFPDEPAMHAQAALLARNHRHGAGRIAQLARLARHQAGLAGRASITSADIAAASWFGDAEGLASFAEPIRQHLADDALVTTPTLRQELDLLVLRCRHRDGLVDGLGAAGQARYRPGVRTLFTGPSGTGKTLAAGWLASRLGIPLFRVDLASVTSKYIGETEKNLAQLLARAEQAEVVLLFDEADSLFGKRTDIRDSNDRFANAQTNYLLQRLENYDGIVVLTSNGKTRFDAAFTRRLDCVLEFPLPSAEERRTLWLGHLGPGHALTAAELNQLAALVDVAGGHIRNAVLTAALLAREAGRRVTLADAVRGLESEFRKLGRALPGGLPPHTPSHSHVPRS